MKEDISWTKKKLACEVELPKTTPVNFAFIGKKSGKFNLLIQVSGPDKKTEKAITKRQLIENLEIQAKTSWWTKLFSSPLIGVVIEGSRKSSREFVKYSLSLERLRKRSPGKISRFKSKILKTY